LKCNFNHSYHSPGYLASVEHKSILIEKEPAKIRSPVLPMWSASTLRSATQNYEERHGLVKEKKPTTVEVVRQRLRKVINPLTGLNVVRTNLVQDIKVKDGTVRVLVDLPRDHQFAHNITDEILEKTESLWNVKGVVVEFTE